MSKQAIENMGLYAVYQNTETGDIFMSPQGVHVTKVVCMMCGYEGKDCDDIFRHTLFDCEEMRREWKAK